MTSLHAVLAVGQTARRILPRLQRQSSPNLTLASLCLGHRDHLPEEVGRSFDVAEIGDPRVFRSWCKRRSESGSALWDRWQSGRTIPDGLIDLLRAFHFEDGSLWTEMHGFVRSISGTIHLMAYAGDEDSSLLGWIGPLLQQSTRHKIMGHVVLPRIETEADSMVGRFERHQARRALAVLTSEDSFARNETFWFLDPCVEGVDDPLADPCRLIAGLSRDGSAEVTWEWVEKVRAGHGENGDSWGSYSCFQGDDESHIPGDMADMSIMIRRVGMHRLDLAPRAIVTWGIDESAVADFVARDPRWDHLTAGRAREGVSLDARLWLGLRERDLETWLAT